VLRPAPVIPVTTTTSPLCSGGNAAIGSVIGPPR
jgi:hypothetical protein